VRGGPGSRGGKEGKGNDHVKGGRIEGARVRVRRKEGGKKQMEGKENGKSNKSGEGKKRKRECISLVVRKGG